jgi:hypothetical protein
MGSNCDYTRPVRQQTGELRVEQSARLAAPGKSARAAVRFCERAATIAENMTAFQPSGEKLEAIFEGSKESPNFTNSSRDKGVFTRDTRTSRNLRNLHGINHITLSRVGQNRSFRNALLWCIQYLKYHFNILILECLGWRLNPRHSACAQNVFPYRASGLS